MKRFWAAMMLVMFLAGCQKDGGEFEKVMGLRSRILNSNGCSFEAEVTADFSDHAYSFAMDCEADGQGNVSFAVTSPETIAGISGRVESGTGKLVFDNTALVFDLKADGYLSPVSAPWIVMKALRSGYVRICGEEEGKIRATIHDSYEEDALHLELWLAEGNPVWAEIYQDNRRILTVGVKNFTIR